MILSCIPARDPPAWGDSTVAKYQIWHSNICQSADSVRLMPLPHPTQAASRILSPIMRHGAGVIANILAPNPRRVSSQRVLGILNSAWLPVANAMLLDKGYHLRAHAVKLLGYKRVIVTVTNITNPEGESILNPNLQLLPIYDPPPPYTP